VRLFLGLIDRVLLCSNKGPALASAGDDLDLVATQMTPVKGRARRVKNSVAVLVLMWSGPGGGSAPIESVRFLNSRSPCWTNGELQDFMTHSPPYLSWPRSELAQLAATLDRRLIPLSCIQGPQSPSPKNMGETPVGFFLQPRHGNSKTHSPVSRQSTETRSRSNNRIMEQTRKF